MNILNKIKINYLTIFIILSAFFCGLFNYIFILGLIIIVHELGHIIVIKLLKYEIINIEFLPFGGKVNISKNINSPIYHDTLISLAGLSLQLIFYLIISYIYNLGYINPNYYLIFKNYNWSIFLFNLLPIYPLDGFFFLKSLIEQIQNFYNSIFICLFLSIIFLIFFIFLNYINHLDNYLICVFLIYKLLNYLNSIKDTFNLFLLERYLYDYKFKKRKIIFGKNIKKMQKGKRHYFLINNKLVNEKKLLAKIFDKDKHF